MKVIQRLQKYKKNKQKLSLSLQELTRLQATTVKRSWHYKKETKISKSIMLTLQRLLEELVRNE